jgi:hypothetical protein
MSKPYANIQPGFDTFAAWLTKTNNLLADMSTIVVTTASNTSGAITDGNAYVNGTLSAAIGAFNVIRGGNVSTNADLSITSNVVIANGYSIILGNTTVNTTINATSFSGRSNTATALHTARNIALSTDATGNTNFDGTANVVIAVTLANSGVTANTYGNSTVYPVITVDAKGRVTNVSAQTISIPAGGVTSFNTRSGAVTLTAADITGNSSVGLNYTPVSANASGNIAGSLTLTGGGDFIGRDFLSSRDVRAGNSTANTVANSTGVTISTNTTTISTINSTTLAVGNSTINTIINSTSLSTSGIIANGSESLPSIALNNIAENITVSNTAANGTINLDVITQSVLWYTANATGNWTINVRGSSTVQLNSWLANNKAISLVFLAAQGATAYYANAFTIDGNAITPRWLGSVPVTGTANSVESYTYTIAKTASNTYSVLASQAAFK